MPASARSFAFTGAAALVCAVLAGCGGGGSVAVSATGAASSQSSSAGSSGVPTVPVAHPSSSGAAAPSYVVGQCYSQPDWKLTPCTQPHQKEITAVVDNSRHVGDLAERSKLRRWTCNHVLPGYVGSSSAGVSRIFATPVATADDPGADQHIVCAAGVQKADDSGVQTVSYALRNRIKHKGYVPYRLCTIQRPSTVSADSLTFVPCSRPHRAETTGGFVLGTPDGSYPGAKAALKDATALCVPLDKQYIGVAHTTRHQIVAYSMISNKSSWQRGTSLVACFIEATKGTFVKPLKGMKDQPLSHFR